MNNAAKGRATLTLEAADTWFFRETKPHDAVGVTQLRSLFPPPAPTVLGAIGTLVGDLLDIDWQAWSGKQPQHRSETAEQLFGTPTKPGALQLEWVLPALYGRPLYPVPFDVLFSNSAQKTMRLSPGNPVRCDLGTVALPTLPDNSNTDARPREHYWLTQLGFQQYLSGIAPALKTLVPISDLFSEESRLGIGRNNVTGTVVEGLLYQTQHLRLAPEFSLQCSVSGLPPTVLSALASGSQTVRLGGEGRPAFVSHMPEETIDLPVPHIPSDRFVITLISHMPATDSHTPWLPIGFDEYGDNEGVTRWRGTLQGIGITIESAAVGKPVREGGWDMRKHEPKAVTSYIPAGTTYFCKLTDRSQLSELPKLHLTHLSVQQHLGHGLIVLGNR